jgi:hypothetical protein
MKRLVFPVFSILSAAILAAGCNASTGSDLGDPVSVQFGDGDTTIHLRDVVITQATNGATLVSAQMDSELPDVYSLQAEFQSNGSLSVLLHNGAEISHQITLSSKDLMVEFMRPSWERTESIGFSDAVKMSSWMQGHVDAGTADCGQVSKPFQDMPLQYAALAIMDYLVVNHQVAIDQTRLSRIMCAQAADEAGTDTVRLDYPRAYAGWDALKNGAYLPPSLIDELPAYQEPAMVTKNNCPREIKSVSVASTYTDQTYNYVPTNLALSCDDAVLEVDAQCCVDEDLIPSARGTMRQISTPSSSFCYGVNSSSGAATNFAFFDFAANANVCPSAGNSCWGNGSADTTKPFNCTLTGFDSASSATMKSSFGGDSVRASGVAGWNYLHFSALLCFEHGDTVDTIYKQAVTVDTNKPSGTICGADNTVDCYCAGGV